MRRPIKPGTRVAFALTAKERDLIVERAFLHPDIDDRIRTALVSGRKLCANLTLDEIDELADCVAAAANHSAEVPIRMTLLAVCDRLTTLEATTTDKEPAPTAVGDTTSTAPPAAKFTAKEGQYLAFIYHYSKVNRRPPAEADLQQYFRVSAPVVHAMILALASRGLIARTPGAARSVRVLIAASGLPALE